ncbi:MAG: lytic transglycosylase, partial [Roseiarcus sp.]
MRALLLAVAAALALGAPPARAQESGVQCGKSGEGFSQWLSSFREVAVLDGVSHEVVDAALSGISYDPSVKAH